MHASCLSCGVRRPRAELISTPGGAAICPECVTRLAGLAAGIGRGEHRSEGEPPPDLSHRCHFCGKGDVHTLGVITSGRAVVCGECLQLMQFIVANEAGQDFQNTRGVEIGILRSEHDPEAGSSRPA